MAEPIVAPVESVTPVVAPVVPVTPVAPTVDDTTLLGKEEGKEPVAKEPTATTEIEKLAAETKAKEAEANKKLLEADDKTLSKEDLAKKEALVKEQKDNTVPEKYEFKAPDGMTLDQAKIDAVTPLFKELNLTNAQAQKLVDYQASVIKQEGEAQMKSYNSMRDGWKAETQKILGAEPAKELAPAAKFINKFFSPQFRQLLNDSGFGDNPEFVKGFIAAGKAISEDAMPGGKKTNENKSGGIDSDVFYNHPTSPK
jgi:hypothetical protein